MYCGICVEVCPFDALFWSPEFEYSEPRIAELLHDKDKLGEWMETVPEPEPLGNGRREGQEVVVAREHRVRGDRGRDGTRCDRRRHDEERRARGALSRRRARRRRRRSSSCSVRSSSPGCRCSSTSAPSSCCSCSGSCSRARRCIPRESLDNDLRWPGARRVAVPGRHPHRVGDRRVRRHRDRARSARSARQRSRESALPDLHHPVRSRRRAPARRAHRRGRPGAEGLTPRRMLLNQFLILSAFLFCTGIYGVLARKHTVLVLMSVELMLAAVNINLVAFGAYHARRRRAGVRAVRAHDRGRRSRCRARDRAADLPQPPQCRSRRRRRAEGLTGQTMWFLDNAWLVPLIPAVSFVAILLFGKTLAEARIRDRHRRRRSVVRPGVRRGVPVDPARQRRSEGRGHVRRARAASGAASAVRDRGSGGHGDAGGRADRPLGHVVPERRHQTRAPASRSTASP